MTGPSDTAFTDAAFDFGGPALRDGFAGEMDDGIGVAQGVLGRRTFHGIPDGDANSRRKVCTAVAAQHVH